MRLLRLPLVAILLLVPVSAASAQGKEAALPRLKVSENGRFLVTADGKPFFYLADTAWELFHRLRREQAEVYLKDRAARGFTVIQAVILAELDGLHDPNPYGHTPLTGDDPLRPNEKYFEHVDGIVRKAESVGLYIGMLPTWGDKWNKKWGVGPEIFTPQNAEGYGAWLGRRYRDHAILWILGGDRPVETERHKEIIRAMARGLRQGDGGAHLITFHPTGGNGSAEAIPEDFGVCSMLRRRSGLPERVPGIPRNLAEDRWYDLALNISRCGELRRLRRRVLLNPVFRRGGATHRWVSDLETAVEALKA